MWKHISFFNALVDGEMEIVGIVGRVDDLNQV